MKSIDITVMWGDKIEDISNHAIALATKYNCRVNFTFNSVKLYARTETTRKEIIQVYNYLFDKGRA